MILLRFSGFLTALILLSACTAPQGPTLWSGPFQRGERSNPDYVRPALNDGTTFPASQDSWTPEDWTSENTSPQNVVDGFYRGGLITGQYMEGGIPVITVGHNFMRLSDRDKARVAAYLDHANNYTGGKGGMFYLYYPPGKKPFGIYTKQGLILQ